MNNLYLLFIGFAVGLTVGFAISAWIVFRVPDLISKLPTGVTEEEFFLYELAKTDEGRDMMIEKIHQRIKRQRIIGDGK